MHVQILYDCKYVNKKNCAKNIHKAYYRLLSLMKNNIQQERLTKRITLRISSAQPKKMSSRSDINDKNGLHSNRL